MADYVLTTSGDTLSGTAGADLFSGPAGGPDSLSGAGGDDRFVLDSGSMGTVDGGDGTDTVTAGYELGSLTFTNVEVLEATSEQIIASIAQIKAFRDVVTAGSRVEFMLTGAGGVVDLSAHAGLAANSIVNGYILSSPVIIIGSTGDDHLVAQLDGDSELRGGLGNDTLVSGVYGRQTFDGGAGDDFISLINGSSLEADVLGGAGNDTVVLSDFGAPVISGSADGGSGIDTVVAANGLGGLTFTGFEVLQQIEGAGFLLAGISQLAAFRHIESTDPAAREINLVLYASGGRLDLGARIVSGAAATGDASQVSSALDLRMTASNDAFILSAYDDTVDGGAGGDYLVSSGGHDALYGNAGNDTLDGGDGNDLLGGLRGDDLLLGGAGDDTYLVNSLRDIVTELAGGGTDTVLSGGSFVLGAHTEKLELTGSADVDATGNELANTLTGNGGRNLLDGGAGADSMAGGAGNDIYVVDQAGDQVQELLGGGNDMVLSSASITLAHHVERLTLTGGAAAIDGAGNALANILVGNAGNNRLDGRSGADIMVGNGGADTYVIDNVGDAVRDGTGLATVWSSISYVAASDIKTLQLIGTANIDATGNAGANLVRGNAGANLLDGKAGADTMAGGQGHDTYVVDATDVVVEAASGGTDEVRSAASYTLGDNIEKLTLTGYASVSAVGNGLANTLAGNSAGNLLNGGAGADTMAGDAGDDTYVVDTGQDVVIDTSGYDIIISTVSFTMSAGIEQITLTGSADINATGSTGFDRLAGNAGNNVLNGGTNADTMTGGAGNDTYVVDQHADEAVEDAGGGIDTVQSATTFILPDHVERLVLTGSAALEGVGNALANTVTGNAGANTLSGGLGNDTLTGGAGADQFAFWTRPNSASNMDRITDFVVGVDKIALAQLIYDASSVHGSGSNTLDPALFLNGTTPTTHGHRFLYDRASGALLYDADGAGSGAAVQFAQVTPGLALTASDFVVV